MTNKKKYYVVWQGRKTGIFTSWDDCKQQVDGFEAAKYKLFDNFEAAETAFNDSFENYIVKKDPHIIPSSKISSNDIPYKDGIAVDAACSGNPGLMEYRGVHIASKKQLFIQGPFEQGTNNIGEFLALVHGLAYLKKHQKLNTPIYSDSKNAILWVKNKKVNTKLIKNQHNTQIFELIDRAVYWLKNNEYPNPILKWETEDWGENPADFGRK